MKKYFLALLIFACGLALWWLLYSFSMSQKENQKSASEEAELVIQTGLKLYDNVTFYKQHFEQALDDKDPNFQKRKALSEDLFYQCHAGTLYDADNRYFYCDHITGYYYNFDVPARGVRINYLKSHLWYYGDEENQIFPPPKFEQRYLSGNALYGDGRFMLSFFPTGSQERMTPPNVLNYLGEKFYLTESEDYMGFIYKTIPNREQEQWPEFGRLKFFTHPSKNYYYSIFNDCRSFCWTDHHEFELFLK